MRELDGFTQMETPLCFKYRFVDFNGFTYIREMNDALQTNVQVHIVTLRADDEPAWLDQPGASFGNSLVFWIYMFEIDQIGMSPPVLSSVQKGPEDWLCQLAFKFLWMKPRHRQICAMYRRGDWVVGCSNSMYCILQVYCFSFLMHSQL